jgi:hypothetical protein
MRSVRKCIGTPDQAGVAVAAVHRRNEGVLSGSVAEYVSGGKNPRITGDVADCESSAFCCEGAVVLASVQDARRRSDPGGRGVPQTSNSR